MISLSVNVNKIATLRNSRGGTEPSVLQAVEICLAAGAPGITVHPRADERHIRRQDVLDIAALLARRPVSDGQRIEFNMEGDPRESFLELVHQVRPAQCTLVPVAPGEITSQAGWPATTSSAALGGIVWALRKAGVRVSLFIDPVLESVRWAASLGADRVELYTEPFASAYDAGPAEGRASFARYADAATLAHELGLGVNAGHDLDLENLQLFRTLPYLDEVSIGHALITHALWVGLEQAVTDYLEAVKRS
ncbi:MAG TPA: pyridoxine 5'-phosphate synthase [Vicinamibacterales bacterium]|nr:pyridoxine 5'-phosphate synthase [Vicinamibacterales bacterium]